MERSTKIKVIASVAVVLTSFALGRYTVPEKVKIETKVVEVDKKVKRVKKDVKIHVTTVKRPDGTVETNKTITDQSKTDSKDDSSKVSDKQSETVRGDSKVTIGLMGGVDFLSGKTLIGGSVYKPLFGPIGFGAWGLSNTSFGGTIGLSF